MPVVSGPQLDEVVEEVKEWYSTMRQWLIERLEEGGHAYGNIKLTQEEQVQKVLSWGPEDWQKLYRQRLERYRGLEDADDRAKADVQRFMVRMSHLIQGGSNGGI